VLLAAEQTTVRSIHRRGFAVRTWPIWDVPDWLVVKRLPPGADLLTAAHPQPVVMVVAGVGTGSTAMIAAPLVWHCEALPVLSTSGVG